jgi:hypothetical protein
MGKSISFFTAWQEIWSQCHQNHSSSEELPSPCYPANRAADARLSQCSWSRCLQLFCELKAEGDDEVNVLIFQCCWFPVAARAVNCQYLGGPHSEHTRFHSVIYFSVAALWSTGVLRAVWAWCVWCAACCWLWCMWVVCLHRVTGKCNLGFLMGCKPTYLLWFFTNVNTLNISNQNLAWAGSCTPVQSAHKFQMYCVSYWPWPWCLF